MIAEAARANVIDEPAGNVQLQQPDLPLPESEIETRLRG